MNSYQERIQEELFALSEKMQKLLTFIDSEAFDALPLEEKVLQEKQYEFMKAYYNALQDRLDFKKDYE